MKGESSCFTDNLQTLQPCKALEAGKVADTQPLSDVLADGTAAAGSHGDVCKLYADAGANIGALNVSSCADKLACTPLQVLD